MKINDLNGLLQEKSIEEQMDLVLEELEVAATEDRDPKEMTPDEDNKDVYPADEHKQSEEVEGVVVKEESQTAAGPELERAAELKNDATLEKAPAEMSSEIDNKDVYPADEHSQKDEVGEVVVEGCAKKSLKNSKVLKEKESYSDFDLMKILDENGYEASLDNLLILKEQLAEGSIVIEDAMESDPVVEATKEKVDDTDKEAETGDLEKAEKPLVDEDDNKSEEAKEEKAEEDKKEETDDKVEELIADKEEKEDAPKAEESEEEKEEELSEGLKSLFSLINSINESVSQVAAGPELGNAAELKNEATDDKKPEEMASEKDNKDVYPADEHKQAEEVEGVVVKEESQVAAGPELGNAAELKNEATDDKKPEEMASEKDNKDVYPADDHNQAEDVEGVVIKEWDIKAYQAPEKLKGTPAGREWSSNAKDSWEKRSSRYDEETGTKGDRDRYSIRESEQNSAGPELKTAKELKNEATLEKDPTIANQSTG